VTGIDISEAFVTLANENSLRAGVADRATFLVGDAAQMCDFADRSFDVVMSNQSFHYWEKPECVLDQIARVLTPYGVFCIGDDRRDMQWRGRLQVLLGRCFLSGRIGASWARSVSGSLTLAEATDAFERSGLRNRWQIAIRPRSMLITSKPGEQLPLRLSIPCGSSDEAYRRTRNVLWRGRVLKCPIMQKRKRRPVDRAQRLLGILGWSYGDLSYRRRDGHCVWQVYADHRWSAGSREKTVGTT